MKTNLAPIALFVYNRPKHTQQTLKSLMNANLAELSQLYIFADGAKLGADAKQIENIKATRKLIKELNWPGKLTVIESETNKGLANSIIEGVTKLVNEFGKIIVLEDDLLVSKSFLEYMNDSLRIFENEEIVYGISGYSFAPGLIKKENYFLPIGSSWGWATWNRAWKNISFDTETLIQEIEKNKLIIDFDFGKYPYFKMLNDQKNGLVNSWAIRFYASFFLKKGIFLFPKESLVLNIGFDNSGTNCGEYEQFPTEKLIENIKVEKIEAKLDTDVVKKVTKFFLQKNKQKKGIKNKAITLIKRIYAR
ncbi:MAG: glycosyltransferase family 2 protein [Bacteroidota bacterium]